LLFSAHPRYGSGGAGALYEQRAEERLAGKTAFKWRPGMTTFDEREKGFEKKFAHDQDLKFKAEARRNKYLGEWAAAKLGITGPAVEEYVKAVRKSDLSKAGDDDVLAKVAKDFTDKGVPISAADIRKHMTEFLAKAVEEIEGKKA
jgi:hypothetical protein